MSGMQRLCIIEPVFTNYRLPVYTELACYCPVDWIFSPAAAGAGHGSRGPSPVPGLRYIEVPAFRPGRTGMVQRGIVKHILRERPRAVLISADLRYLSFWTTLLAAKLAGVPVYAHGHGLYRRRRIPFALRCAVKFMLRLVTAYIAYAPMVRESLLRHGFRGDKVAVASNSMVNAAPVPPVNKTGMERGVLFLGRLREDCNLDLLIRVLARLRQKGGIELSLHVIGEGEQEYRLRKDSAASPWIHWYGGVYDHQKISRISARCFVGCYPGSAGLSVVHMMSLSLPVVVHHEARLHGPEVSFVLDGISGVFFDRRDPEESLHRALQFLASDPPTLAGMQQAAFETYQDLVNPPLAARLWSILSGERAAAAEGLVPAGKPTLGLPPWIPR